MEYPCQHNYSFSLDSIILQFGAKVFYVQFSFCHILKGTYSRIEIKLIVFTASSRTKKNDIELHRCLIKPSTGTQSHLQKELIHHSLLFIYISYVNVPFFSQFKPFCTLNLRHLSSHFKYISLNKNSVFSDSFRSSPVISPPPDTLCLQI